MNELIQIAQMIMQFLEIRGPSLNVESQKALAQLLQGITQIIEQMGQNAGTPPSPPIPIEPPPAGMPSSNVAGTQYDPESGNMLIQFLGKFPNRNGPVYKYSDVPPVIAELVQSGAVPARTLGKNKWGSWFPGKHPSAGASVSTLLKNTGIQYQRLT